MSEEFAIKNESENKDIKSLNKDFSPIKMNKIPEDKLSLARLKIKQILSNNMKSNPIVWDGKFDDIYYESIQYFENDS